MQRRTFDRQTRITSFIDPLSHFGHVLLDRLRNLRIVRFRYGANAVGEICHRAFDVIVIEEQGMDVAALVHGRFCRPSFRAHPHHAGPHLAPHPGPSGRAFPGPSDRACPHSRRAIPPGPCRPIARGKAAGEQGGGRDAADQPELFSSCVSNGWQRRDPLPAPLERSDFTEVFQHRVFCDKVCHAPRLVNNPKTHSDNVCRALVYIPDMQGAPHILIVDDHREIRDLVSRALSKEGFRVSTAADGRAMRKILADSRIDLILLDLMLPGEDGLSLCRSLRAESNIPIIMLTAKGEEVDRVIGLEMGADDYLAEAVRQPRTDRADQGRPAPQLRRHVSKAIRRNARRAIISTAGRWTPARALLRDDGVTVPLSTGEYDLLIALVERPQRVLNRDQLLDLARGRSAAGLDRSIDTQVSRLRKKLEHRSRAIRKIIKTVWGGGYMFTPAVTRNEPVSSQEPVRPDPADPARRSDRLACVGSWIYTADREQAVRAVGGFAAAQRIANLTRLVQDAPREWRERIVAALSDQTLRVRFRLSLRRLRARMTTAPFLRPSRISSRTSSRPALRAAACRLVSLRTDPPFASMHPRGPGQ